MDVFQGKIHRYLIFTGVAYAALHLLAASPPIDVVQVPKYNKPGIEDTIPQEDPANKLENELLKKQQKPIEQPKDKYGPKWQEEIRREYRTKLA